jgi:hypothetical protein
MREICTSGATREGSGPTGAYRPVPSTLPLILSSEDICLTYNDLASNR